MSLDTTALDPADTDVLAEVARRISERDYIVTKEPTPNQGASWLESLSLQWRIIWTNIIVFVLFVVFIVLLFAVVPSSPEVGGVIAVVFLIAASVLIVIPKGLPIPPPPSSLRKRITREVRLAHMAKRNGYAYHCPGVPGHLLFGTHNPLTARSVLTKRRSDMPTGARFMSSACEFGTLLTASRETMRRSSQPVVLGQYMTFRLSHTLPHIVCESLLTTTGSLGAFDSPVVPIDADFDAAFTTYAPGTSATQVQRLLSPPVRKALLALAPTHSVEFIGGGLVLFHGGAADYTKPAVWETVHASSTLVTADILPALAG